MQHLRHTTFDVRRFEFSPTVLEECLTPSFTAITDSDPVRYFNIELPSTHRLLPWLPALLSQSCSVHVSLTRRFSLYSTLSDICEYDCKLLPSVNAIVLNPVLDLPSSIVIHWDGRINSTAAKRSRGIDTVIDFERDYKSWRFDSYP
uniref:S1 protein n=1 Tax=Avian orthoreovirus TaxID=38170 RepID=Q84143_9REOV|nr:ORF [Avian orthoreovirus]